MHENYLPCKNRIPIRGVENISKSHRDEGKGITLVLSVMAVDGVIYAAWLESEIRAARGRKVGRMDKGGGGRKGLVGQVVGEKNIHARGDAEFSFSRR